MSTSCLVSTVKNVSGGDLLVASWYPHGKTFAADEEASLTGNVLEAMARMGGHKSTRVLDAFVALLTSAKLTIKKTPTPIFYDATADRVAGLNMVNNALFMLDPCWGSTAYTSPV